MTPDLNKPMKSDVYTIIRLSLPMMLVALSNNLMSTIDKMMLAQIDVEVMGMALIAQHVILIPFFGILSLAGIAEVFIGQLNGARKFKQVSQPMWQMVIFSLALFSISIPAGLWAGPYILPPEVFACAHTYFSILMVFVPLAGLIGAFSAFYVGIGRMRHVIWCVVVGNLTGVLVDFVLVLGVNTPQGTTLIAPLGATGAAIGTVCGQLIIVFTLFLGLFKKKFKNHFQTLQFSFDKELLIKQIKIGLPNAISHSGEMFAWTLMLSLVSTLKPEILPEVTIPCALFSFLVFTTDGLQKGTIAIASNLIGGKYFDHFRQLNKSIIKTSLLLIVVVALPLLVFPEWIAGIYNVNTPSEELIFAIRMISFYLIIDIPMWQLVGLLTSGGDTRFIMMTNLASSWLLCVLPFYIALKLDVITKGSQIWFIFMGYAFFNLILYFSRYSTNKWRHNLFASPQS